MRRKRWLFRIAGLVLLVAAIREEMSKPESERTGYGRVWGTVPYDFRAPTFDRIRERLWNPEDQRLVVPSIWGVGWTVNIGRAVALAREQKA